MSNGLTNGLIFHLTLQFYQTCRLRHNQCFDFKFKKEAYDAHFQVKNCLPHR